MRLYVLDHGTLEMPLGALVPGEGGKEWISIGVPGYLIQTDDGANVLVDSGMPRAYIDDPAGAAKRDDYDKWLRSRATAANLPAAQLAKIGLTPAEITHVIVTHTHIDHAGGIADFPAAVHIIQRAERELERPVYRGLDWQDGVQWQVVEGDAEPLPGIRLLYTPGHTPGHQSVLVDLPRTGKVLLAIDAIYLPLALEKDNFKASWNEELARDSGHRVARLADELGAWLVFGHDPAQWATLNKAPEYYD